MNKRALACLVIALGLLIAVAVPAAADFDVHLDEGGVSGSLGVTPPTPPVAGPTGNRLNPGTRVVADGILCADDQDPLKRIGQSSSVQHLTPAGWVTISQACVYPGLAAPAPPPPPPTPAEVWARVPLNKATLGVSPRGEGVTGFPTWFWYEGGTEGVSLNLGLRGYSLTVQAKPYRFTWTTGDGASGGSSHPGSPDKPAFTHTYQTRGDYRLTMTVSWAGTYSFSGYGISQTGSLGSVTVEASRAYHVYEVRGVLR